MDTDSANDAKANFESIYVQNTPHDYLRLLGGLDYSICDEARPYCAEALGMVREDEATPRMLDIGCSYGINAAVVKHATSFPELRRLFANEIPRDPEAARRTTRDALAEMGTQVPLETVGLDVSAPAVRFATDVGLLDHGIVADLESDPGALSATDREWLRGVHVILATGAIGYVTERTFRSVLEAMGPRAEHALALLTVLRVFDAGPIVQALRDFGLETVTLPRVLLPQRRFHQDGEQDRVLRVLEAAGVDTRPEAGGRHYARLLVAARPERVQQLVTRCEQIAAERGDRTGEVRPV